jgi:hypothetical protein
LSKNAHRIRDHLPMAGDVLQEVMATPEENDARAKPYAYAPTMRAITRLRNGVPVAKVGALYRREYTLARAKALHEGASG